MCTSNHNDLTSPKRVDSYPSQMLTLTKITNIIIPKFINPNLYGPQKQQTYIVREKFLPYHFPSIYHIQRYFTIPPIKFKIYIYLQIISLPLLLTIDYNLLYTVIY